MFNMSWHSPFDVDILYKSISPQHIVYSNSLPKLTPTFVKQYHVFVYAKVLHCTVCQLYDSYGTSLTLVFVLFV